jgi:fermentation-respiration switch protein FrsA (DUF1100 family)
VRSFACWFSLLVTLQLGACTSLLFYPQRELVLTPDRVGLAYRDVWFKAADGTRLHGWFLPAGMNVVRGEACTVLFLHGNAENISTHIGNVAWLPGKGYNVFLFDYRGYGRSAGEPSLPGLHLDAEAALAAVFTMTEVNSDRIVVFGQSLGGDIAITALAGSVYRHQIRALVIEGAFSSYRGIVREKLAELWLTWPVQWPLSLTIDNQYKPLEAIDRISPVPVLFIHGLVDRVVSPHHAEALYAAAGEPRELWLVPGAGHIQALRHTDAQQRLLGYLAVHCNANGQRKDDVRRFRRRWRSCSRTYRNRSAEPNG